MQEERARDKMYAECEEIRAVVHEADEERRLCKHIKDEWRLAQTEQEAWQRHEQQEQEEEHKQQEQLQNEQRLQQQAQEQQQQQQRHQWSKQQNWNSTNVKDKSWTKQRGDRMCQRCGRWTYRSHGRGCSFCGCNAELWNSVEAQLAKTQAQKELLSNRLRAQEEQHMRALSDQILQRRVNSEKEAEMADALLKAQQDLEQFEERQAKILESLLAEKVPSEEQRQQAASNAEEQHQQAAPEEQQQQAASEEQQQRAASGEQREAATEEQRHEAGVKRKRDEHNEQDGA